MDVDVKALDGTSVGTIALPEAVFGLEPRADILQRVVRWQLAKRRAGTHFAKTRHEVVGSGAKRYRQKGTGRARHSDTKAPQFRGGGKAFGPVVRDHAHDLPKKVRALGLRHALSAKLRANALIVIDDLSVSEVKTKEVTAALKKLGLDNALIVSGIGGQGDFAKAARNIPLIDVLPVVGLNVYDILRRDTLVLSRAALTALEERFA